MRAQFVPKADTTERANNKMQNPYHKGQCVPVIPSLILHAGVCRHRSVQCNCAMRFRNQVLESCYKSQDAEASIILKEYKNWPHSHHGKRFSCCRSGTPTERTERAMEGINGIFLILLAACIFGYAFCQPQKAPKVTIACGGQLEGKIVATPRGICHAFFGVPFAAPPVGELRFEVSHGAKPL